MCLDIASGSANGTPTSDISKKESMAADPFPNKNVDPFCKTRSGIVFGVFVGYLLCAHVHVCRKLSAMLYRAEQRTLVKSIII